MKLRSFISPGAVLMSFLFAAIFSGAALRGDDDDAPAATDDGTSTRYGLFNGLDHRSSYGLDVFPEPFLLDDSNKEDNEGQLAWFYSKAAGHQQENLVTAEFEHGFGDLTIEMDVPYEIGTARGQSTYGWGNTEVRARHPLFEAVTPSGFADTTFGVAVGLGIPLHTAFSKDTELVPQVFNDTRFGNFTLQSIFGYSMLFGASGDDGASRVFEYGTTLGYAIQKPCPGVEQLIPLFEISGEKDLNGDGTNSMIASVGFHVNFKAIGEFQPRLGIGYVFPMNRAALNDLQSGIYTSFIFDF